MDKSQIVALIVFVVGTGLDTWTTHVGITRYGFREGNKFAAWLHERVGILGSLVKEAAFATVVIMFAPGVFMSLLLWLGGGTQALTAYRNWKMIEKRRHGK